MKNSSLKFLSMTSIMFVFSGCSISKQSSNLAKVVKIETKITEKSESNSVSINEKTDFKAENCVGVMSSHTSFASDPSVTENLIKISKSVLKIKVKGKGDTVYPAGYPYPLTKYDIDVIEVLNGSEEQKDLKEITVTGGNVSVFDYKKANPDKEDKLGFNKYSDSEAREKFLLFKESYDYDLQNNHEYIVILNDNNTVINNGYGIFETDKNKTSIVMAEDYLNVLTKKRFPKIK